MKKIISDELKKKQLNLFKHFLLVCEKENLQYFLLGGSCLGAVRHKGFIPWDDDIDVGLPRPDYDKFLKCAQDILPGSIFLQTYKTDPGYLNNFAKLRDCDTTFIETSCKNLKINHGVCIDIFPLDGASNSKELGVKQLKRINWYSRPINEKYYFPNNRKGKMVNRLLKSMFYPIVFHNVETCLEKRDLLYREFSYEESLYIANYGGAWGAREIMSKAYFGNGFITDFEGIRVCIPEDYDAYLTAMYGDYMTLPPFEKQIGHHYCEIIDLKKSYKEYM